MPSKQPKVSIMSPGLSPKRENGKRIASLPNVFTGKNGNRLGSMKEIDDMLLASDEGSGK